MGTPETLPWGRISWSSSAHERRRVCAMASRSLVLPTGSHPSVWLRWPYLVTCDHADVRLFYCSDGDDALRLHSAFSLARYRGAEMASGRGAQVLQSVDV